MHTQSRRSTDTQLSRHSWHAWQHALLVIGGYIAVFGWLYLRPVLDGSFLAESDLYEYYLPIFLAPITRWSHFEFGGLPAFADPGDFTVYPLHFLFARVFSSWTALLVSAFVMAACFTYAYVYHLKRSATAAAFAGLAYGLSEAMMERLPHPGTLHAFAWLPLLLLSLERIDDGAWSRWVAVGSLAVGCCFLAGHPQAALYVYYCAGLYALVKGRAEGAGRKYYLRVAALFAIGGLLACIKALPLVEASTYMARQEVGLGQFVSHANSPAQMWSLIFPTILHEGREAPTYVGLITIGLAVVGLSKEWRASWRAPFWACVVAFALLIGVGASTPVATAAYYFPLYDNFRVSARHLFLAAFGLSLLAGLGIAAIQRNTVSTRLIGSAVVVLLSAVTVGAVVLASSPDIFQFEPRERLPWTLPVWNDGTWVQFAVALATAAVMLAAFRLGRTRVWIVTACALLFVDTLYSLPYSVTPTGIVPITLPASATQPSVHATRLAMSLEPLHQRLLASEGTHLDAVVPAAWARVWQIPIAGGYGPMLLSTHNAIAQMGTNGSVRGGALAPNDVGLDILAVSRVVLRTDAMTRPPTFQRDGLTWSAPPLGISIGRADCEDHPYARTLSVPLPRDVDIAEIALVGHMRCLEHVAHETNVLRVEMLSGAETVHAQQLRAGIDLAELALSDPLVAARANHAPARVFDDPELPPFMYLTRIRPPAPVPADRLVLQVPPLGGWLTIERLTIVDSRGTSMPLSIDDLYLADGERWVESERFDTSRTSDRGRDERGAEESEFVVFENLRALPRAWMVSEVVPVEAPSLLEALRHSQLPDGRPFDPRVMALVDASEHDELRRFTPGNASVSVDSMQNGHVVIDVASNGGYLVLSEAYYPGWRARIGATRLEVERTNLGLQGVVVPPGAHRIEFAFDPLALRLGKVASAAGLFVTFGLLCAPLRLRTNRASRP